jgi:thiol-disulfide isomerase/thioredoxin
MRGWRMGLLRIAAALGSATACHLGCSPVRRRRLAASLLACAALLGILGLGLRPAQPSPSGASWQSPRTVAYPAPDFALRDLRGATVRLSALRGRPVLLNFWATWCLPCRREMPALERAYRRYQVQGRGHAGGTPLILGIDAGAEDRATVAGFARRWGITYPLLLDPLFQVTLVDYRVIGIPTSIVVDSRGIARRVRLGALAEGEIGRLLDSAR